MILPKVKSRDKMAKNVDRKGSDGSMSLSSGDENVERGNWSHRLDFMMSCISYAVGLGNIWRFPYLCYRNGGATFMIPYLMFLFLCGLPLVFMEMGYGQFASLSPITSWGKLAPLLKGVGYGMVMISAICCIYYNVIIAWTFHYFFNSFRPVLPWSTCTNEWNTPQCSLNWGGAGNASLNNVTDMTESSITFEVTENSSVVDRIKRVSPSEEYWENRVLKLSSGIDDMGGVQWELMGCLIFAWVLVFFSLIKGIKSSGKVVYFTAAFPYLVLFILLIRGVTLPGAKRGLLFYLVPEWSKLLSLKVWGEAAMQIFYSIGAAWGALLTMASYNKFHHDCYLDARILPIINSGTSIFTGFVIFSIIGFMAEETGSSIHEVIKEGPGLVFVVYPEALGKMPVPQLWSVMFFSMLLSVGVGSQIGMFQTVTSAVFDEFPHLRSRKLLVTAGLCIVEFALGIPCVFQGGIYYLQIIDWYSSVFSLMILSILELVVISWVYGVDRFYKDIELMIGYRPCIAWKIMWCYVTPLLIAFIWTFNVISHTPVTYGSYQYPAWAIFVGWVFALCSLVPVPVMAVIKYQQHSGPFLHRIRRLIRHTDDWGPAVPEHREAYQRSRDGARAMGVRERFNAMEPEADTDNKNVPV